MFQLPVLGGDKSNDASKGQGNTAVRGVHSSRNDNMTEDHRFALLKLKERDSIIVSDTIGICLDYDVIWLVYHIIIIVTSYDC